MCDSDLEGVAKRLTLETENLLELLEADDDSNLRWMDEKDSLIETLREAKEILWKQEELEV